MGGPEGAYTVKIGPDDYYWSLSSGVWHLHLQGPNSSSGDDWFGGYSISTDGITFTIGEGDPDCLGWTWTGRWSFSGESSLQFTDMSSAVGSACGPKGSIRWG